MKQHFGAGEKVFRHRPRLSGESVARWNRVIVTAEPLVAPHPRNRDAVFAKPLLSPQPSNTMNDLRGRLGMKASPSRSEGEEGRAEAGKAVSLARSLKIVLPTFIFQLKRFRIRRPPAVRHATDAAAPRHRQ